MDDLDILDINAKFKNKKTDLWVEKNRRGRILAQDLECNKMEHYPKRT